MLTEKEKLYIERQRKSEEKSKLIARNLNKLLKKLKIEYPNPGCLCDTEEVNKSIATFWELYNEYESRDLE